MKSRSAVKNLRMIAVASVLLSSAAWAAIPRDMIGTWHWQQSTIAATECQPDRICAKIIAGPKNVGMEIFASQLVAKGDDWFAQVVDPETKDVYHTRFRRIDRDTWHLDGCTPAGVCLSGEFVRVK